MKKQTTIIFMITILCMVFFGCDGVATLFHGEKPKTPPVTYTVTFNGNEATGGTAPERQKVNSGTVVSLPGENTLSKTGNIFVGWCESSSGSGTTYSIGADIKVTRNMVFYARWLDIEKAHKFTVTFNANGANSGTPPVPQEVYEGISITLPGKGTLAHSTKKFGGWNTQENGGGTNYAAGATYTVMSDTILYAKWQSETQYTVTYFANGASGTPPTKQSVDPGTVITIPDQGNMTNLGKTFEGWNTQANGGGTGYAEGQGYTVNGNTSLYAQWVSVPIVPQGATLVEKLEYVRNHTGNGTVFDIVVDRPENIGPQSIDSMGINITVIIHSASPDDVKTIQLTSQGNLFSIDTGITVKLQDIVLRGNSNNKALVAVSGNSTLILNSGSKISGNTNNSSGDRRGGGICINSGNLELNEGAEIIGNKVDGKNASGGGIYIENRSNIIMRGGIISENIVNPVAFGGGIYIASNSTVTMSGGIISKNQANGFVFGDGGSVGGGVYVENGSSFTKRAASGSSTSGIIYGAGSTNENTARLGNAINRDFGYPLTTHNSTLNAGDEITTLSDVGWGL